MKKHLHLLALAMVLFNGINLYGQDEKIGHFFKIKPNVVHNFQECDAVGNVSAGYITKLIPGTSKFTIVNKTAAGDYVIRFWSWSAITNTVPTVAKSATLIPGYIAPNLTSAATMYTATAREKAESYNYVVIGGNWDFRYFKVTQAELELYAVKLESRVLATAGTATMPFKWRHTGGDFSKDLTISNLGGIKHNFNENFGISALLGLGISSVKLDSVNTKGTVKKASDFAAFTISAGVVLEFKRLQFGIFTGWDNLTSSDKNNWAYQGKNWLALGIGFSLFSESSVRTKEKDN